MILLKLGIFRDPKLIWLYKYILEAIFVIFVSESKRYSKFTLYEVVTGLVISQNVLWEHHKQFSFRHWSQEDTNVKNCFLKIEGLAVWLFWKKGNFLRQKSYWHELSWVGLVGLSPHPPPHPPLTNVSTLFLLGYGGGGKWSKKLLPCG